MKKIALDNGLMSQFRQLPRPLSFDVEIKQNGNVFITSGDKTGTFYEQKDNNL